MFIKDRVTVMKKILLFSKTGYSTHVTECVESVRSSQKMYISKGYEATCTPMEGYTNNKLIYSPWMAICFFM